ncbi:MAG TPA: zinc ribbon domain-containing protein [Candidatus Polarisedimenticolia bacterium]|nr:zinc ribbon domain-containing protein [Candidatus Polarisedimenticolia bacterium]
MPLYEYECKRCHHRFERIQKFSDPLAKKCPKCKVGRLEKLISAPAVQFKGTGWYVTDYGGKKGDGEKKESGDKSDSGSKDSEKSASSSSDKSDKKDSGKSSGKSGGSGKSSKS